MEDEVHLATATADVRSRAADSAVCRKIQRMAILRIETSKMCISKPFQKLIMKN